MTSPIKYIIVMNLGCRFNTKFQRLCHTKKVRQVSPGNKTQITILGCASATGQVMPPMVVFTGKHFNHMLSRGEVPGTLYMVCHLTGGWNRNCFRPGFLLIS